MTKQPYLKFWIADHRGETSLKMVSRAARSFWFDLVLLMHEAEMRGRLLINGAPPTPEELAVILGDKLADVKKWLDELEERRVFSRTADGLIYCRRMIRDAEKSATGTASAKDRWEDDAPAKTTAAPIGSPNGSPNGVPITYVLNATPISHTAGGGGKSRTREELPAGWRVPEDWRVAALKARPDLDIDITALSFERKYVGKQKRDDWLYAWDNFVLLQISSGAFARGPRSR